jgi:hypothetical protein
MGRSPSGMSEDSTTGDRRYEWPPLLYLECEGWATGSELVIGASVIRGVSDRRPPKGESGLRLLLAAGGPSAGATTGVSSGVTWRVMGV